MKLAFKYGVMVTIVIAVWVTVKNYVLHLEGPTVPFIDAAVFNLAAIAGLALGIREKRAANGGTLAYLDGFKTGVLIASVYALLSCLFFAVVMAIMGPELMQRAGHTSYVSAFAGLFFGLALFGTVFSAVVALILRKN
jgi:hypothetical protein